MSNNEREEKTRMKTHNLVETTSLLAVILTGVLSIALWLENPSSGLHSQCVDYLRSAGDYLQV